MEELPLCQVLRGIDKVVQALRVGTAERRPSAKLGHWRKAKKARTSSMISQNHPLRQPRQLAEGVEFPEKNAGSRVFEPPFGGGGPPGGGATRLVATLNHTGFQITYLRA